MNLPDVYRILEGFNNIVPSWRGILDSIDDAVQDYNAAIADPTVEDPAAYLREWLPQYWQAVRAINIHQWEGVEQLPSNSEYDVGIFLVGFSSLPIVLSIAEIQPRQEIYFIHSNDTRRECNKITSRFEEMLEDPPSPFNPLIDRPDAASLIARVQSADRREIAEPSDPVSTFQEIKNIIDRVRDSLGDNARIALDLTGGKKTMIGGGFTAGSIYSVAPKCDMFYVDSPVYNPDRGAPKPGTEFLNSLDNPYDVYNVPSVQQARKLFEKHNYEAAAILLEGVVDNLSKYAESYGLQNEQDAVNKSCYMADCYGLWDAFDYSAAKNSKEDNGDLWDYNAKHALPTANIDILGILSEVINPQTLFAEEERIIHYAVDRYQNGIRRMESDRFDDTIVRFTQVVEILCRYHVYQIAENGGLTDNSHILVPRECCLDEEWSITKLIHFLFGRYRDYDGRYRIAHLDERLDIDEYVDYNSTEDITDLIKPRNDFVHVNSNPGWQEMQEDAENLQELAKIFLENFSSSYCCNKGLSFDQLLVLHKFCRLE